MNYNVTLPDYTADALHLRLMTQDGQAVTEGVSLYVGIAGLRSGALTWNPDRAEGKGGWKGVSKWAEATMVSKGQVSKAATAVREFLPDAVTCDESEVRDHVLAFLAEYGNVGAAYEQRDGKPEKAPMSLEDRVHALCVWARNQGFDPTTVTELVNNDGAWQ